MVNKLKMTPHPNNPFLFFGDGIVVVCYVDDQLIVGTTKDKIKKYLQQFNNAKMQFTTEEEILTYLGITANCDKEKKRND